MSFDVLPDAVLSARTTRRYNNNYNIEFVNSERSLVKNHVYITQCKHGKFPITHEALKFCIFLLYGKKYKTFFSCLYTVIATVVEIENTRVSTQFLVFPISTRVDIIVYQYGKC